jgi:hypothetical protein
VQAASFAEAKWKGKEGCSAPLAARTDLDIDFLWVTIYIKRKTVGGLAQFGRAFGWQPKGHRFDPGILHHCSQFAGDHNTS